MRYANVTSLCFVTLLAFNAPEEGVPSRTISVKVCMEVKGWLTYKMAKEYCRKFQHRELNARTLYRRQTDIDSNDPNSNVA